MRYYVLGGMLVVVAGASLAAALGLGVAWVLRRTRRG
jgi:hypothetical protein